MHCFLPVLLIFSVSLSYVSVTSTNTPKTLQKVIGKVSIRQANGNGGYFNLSAFRKPEEQLLLRENSLIDAFLLKRQILQSVYGK